MSIKISDLVADETSDPTKDADLIIMSNEDGGGGYDVSKKISVIQLKAFLGIVTLPVIAQDIVPVGDGTNIEASNAKIGDDGDPDDMFFGHQNVASDRNEAGFFQGTDGNTRVNGKTGQTVEIVIDNDQKILCLAAGTQIAALPGQLVAIGLSVGGNPSTRVQVRGLGDDNTTSSLVITNNDLGNLFTSFEVLDDNSIILKNGTNINEFSIDGTLAGDSDDAVPTEKAVKAYVDSVSGGAVIAESTGVKTGGVMSTGTASDEYSIADGTGQVVDSLGAMTPVTWSGKTNITPTNIATQLITFVGINSSGDVVEQSTRFTNLQSRTIIPLGVAIHVDLVNVDAVNNEQHVAYNVGSQLYDLFEGIGFFNVSGNIFTANGSNLNIDKSAGSMFAAGSNYPNDINNPHPITLGVLSALSFQYRFSDGTNGVTGIVFDPANLDDGAGGLTALSGNNKWGVSRVYSFTSNNVKIQRGVEEFGSKDKAIAGIAAEAFVTEPSIAANGLLRGWIAHRKDGTDLSDSGKAVFIEAPKFQAGAGGIGSTASNRQDTYDNSGANPETLTNSTNGADTWRRGSAADTDDVLEVQNNAGTKNWSVTGEGVVTSKQDTTTLPTTHVPSGTTQTINWNDGMYQIVDLGSATGDVTLTLDNPVTAGDYTLDFIQGATARDVVFPSTVLIAGGTAPLTLDITITDNAIDSVDMKFNGTNYNIGNVIENLG